MLTPSSSHIAIVALRSVALRLNAAAAAWRTLLICVRRNAPRQAVRPMSSGSVPKLKFDTEIADRPTSAAANRLNSTRGRTPRASSRADAMSSASNVYSIGSMAIHGCFAASCARYAIQLCSIR